ncbi:hypothetical protein C8F04DRAFT_1273834 [Mycena alexandri]|uniref:Uncharacterized protein n=1 Tax=Mycena alexandri TaxID=1745969 RepID=A0AAD6S5P7_9AGAR|nr:hypothetical protein C8F04DRAFT_1273834 [Mycena alexandri]
MKNGDPIRRYTGESLVKAAERIAGQGPRVMFALTNPTQDRSAAVHNFYQQQTRRAQVVEVYSGESSPEEEEGNEPDEESPSSDEGSVTSSAERVYFSVPKTHGYQIFEAQRTVPSIRKVRREIFDGVHVPLRGGMKKGEIRDLTGKGKEKVNEPGKAGPSSVPGPAPLPDPKRQPPNCKVPLSRGLDNLQPIEARKVRLEKDTEMRDVEEQEDPAKKSAIKGDAKEEGGTKAGRQLELSATVDRRQVLNRIMDATVPMSIREIMVTSKDLCTDFQDLIKLKNVRAVLLGSTRDHPLIANLNIPDTLLAHLKM